jgi:2-oxoglutarate ferredoxin oxidoreductase subunit alpha
MIIADGVLGQMMEPAIIPEDFPPVDRPEKPWATNGRNGRAHKNVVNSLVIDPHELNAHCRHLQSKYEQAAKECKWDTRFVEDADVLVVAYGIAARLSLSGCKLARKRGVKAGLFRPITLYPYPSEPLRDVAQGKQRILVVELSSGQMVEDVRLAMNGAMPVEFYGEMGGVLPSPSEVCNKIIEVLR